MVLSTASPRVRLSLVGGVVLIALSACTETCAAPITLQQAFALAEARNASLRNSQASRASAEGELRDASALFWNNPQLSAEARHRQLQAHNTDSTQRHDGAVGISQTFEVAGQPRARRSAAMATVDATEHAIADKRREIRAEAAERFIRVLSLQVRVGVEQQSRALIDQGREIVRKRVAAGEESRLEGNLAQVEAQRAANQLAQLTEQLADARLGLAATLQWTDPTPPEAVGNLDAARSAYSLTDLLDSAATHPRLQALAAREHAALNRLDLERASRYPDVTIGLGHSDERTIEGRDRITTLSVSVPLPLFRHNAGAIGRAQTELDQIRVERQAAIRESEAAVRGLWQKLQNVRERVERLQTTVVPLLEQNEALSLKSLQAGAIGLSDFLLVRRQVLDARRDLLEAETDLQLTRIALEAVAAWPRELPPIAQP